MKTPTLVIEWRDGSKETCPIERGADIQLATENVCRNTGRNYWDIVKKEVI